MRKGSLEIRVEILLLGFLVLAGTLLRVCTLDFLPLSDNEAELALSVLGSSFAFQPGAVLADSLFYSLLLWIVGSLTPVSDVTPRLISAVSGSMLLLIPVLVRRKLGPFRTILLTALLAFSPLLITITRTASSAILSAAAGAMVAVSFFRYRESRQADDGTTGFWGKAAAVSTGVFIVSGPEGISAVLAAVVTVYLYSLTRRPGFWRRNLAMAGLWLKEFGWMAAAVVLICTSGLGFRPSGMMEWFNSLQTWLAGWTRPVEYNAGAAAASFLLYESFWLLTAAGMVFALLRRRRQDLLILFWWLTLIVLYWVYPSRTGTGMVWLVLAGVFFAYIALAEIITWLVREPMEPISLEVLGAAAVVVVLLVFAYLQVGGYAQQAYTVELENAIPRLGIAIGAAATGIVVLFFYGMGWGWKFSGLAGTISVGLLMIGLIFASIWHLNFRDSAVSAAEIWRVRSLRSEVYELTQSLENISVASHGSRTGLNIQLESEHAPALAWYLRDYSAYSRSTGMSPEIILVREDDIPASLPEAYTGRIDALYENRGWIGGFPPNLMRWWFKRQAPVYYDEWALLVRSDLMLVQLESELEIGTDDILIDESME